MTAHHREIAFIPGPRKLRMRHLTFIAVSVMLALAVLSATVAPAADDPGSGAESAPELEAADQRVMDEIRMEIEAIPEASREIAGVEILDQSISRFALATTQQRVLVSVGELTAKLGQTDKSIDAFKRGLALAADPLLTLTCRMRLAEILSSAGRTDEAEAVLATVPAPEEVFASPSDLPPDQTDDIYEAERKRIELLIDQGKDEEGFERILRFAKTYPRHTTAPLILFEHITGPMFLTGDYAGAIRWRRRAAEALPHASDDPMFLSNAIVELQSAGRTDEAMKAEATAAMIAFAERFPDHNSTASFLKALGVSAEMAGDRVAAKGYFEKILASNLPPDDPQRRTAADDLARVSGQKIHPATLDNRPTGTPKDQSGRPWLLWLNAALVAAIAVWLLYRRRTHAAGHPGPR
jgi:tetratricopeptide (TPR) repeat protein